MHFTLFCWDATDVAKHVKKIVFATPHDLYELPFSLCSAPAIFQLLMDRVLGNLRRWTTTLVYLDDIVVYAPNLGMDQKHLIPVLQALCQIRLN